MIWNADPTAFSLFGFDIRWYGIVYALGFFFCDWMGWRAMKKKNVINKKQWDNFILGVFILGVLGGRFGEFLFYSPQTFWTDPLEILQIWKGGMSIHGGLISALLWIWFWCKKEKVSPLLLTDALVFPLVIVLIFGRITNWMNGELWGRPTNGNWGVIFPHVDFVPRHPSQLYEAGKYLVLALLLGGIHQLPRWQKPGVQTALFLAGYGILRFIIEFFREPIHGS